MNSDSVKSLPCGVSRSSLASANAQLLKERGPALSPEQLRVHLLDRRAKLLAFDSMVRRGVLNPCAWCDKENGVVSRPSGTSHGICEVHRDELLGGMRLDVGLMIGGAA